MKRKKFLSLPHSKQIDLKWKRYAKKEREALKKLYEWVQNSDRNLSY